MKSKIILITGTSKGIGKFLAENFLDISYNVIGCSRGESTLIHPNYFHISCDVTDEKSVKSAVKAALSRFGKIDILINNAGIASLNHSILTPSTVVKKVFETNFNGTFYFSREVSKVMMRNNGGKIINFTTVAVPLNLEGEMIYASSKAAIEKMTKIMAKELADSNIQINAIGPTPIETDLIKAVPKIKLKELLEKQSIKKFGSFEDVLNVINFFINPKSGMITGQIIYLGGV
jgi:3-oxoacyl-[acyl-carrier protein] reductase